MHETASDSRDARLRRLFAMIEAKGDRCTELAAAARSFALSSYAARRLNCDEIEELADRTQMVAIEAHLQGKSVVALRNPCAWLEVVARNISCDILRERERGERALKRFAQDDVALPETDRVDTQDFLDEAVRKSRLSERHRKILELSMMGMTPRDVAAKLEMSPNAIRSHLCRIRAALRPALLALRGGNTGAP